MFGELWRKLKVKVRWSRCVFLQLSRDLLSWLWNNQNIGPSGNLMSGKIWWMKYHGEEKWDDVMFRFITKTTNKNETEQVVVPSFTFTWILLHIVHYSLRRLSLILISFHFYPFHSSQIDEKKTDKARMNFLKF